MDANAVVLEQPERIALNRLDLIEPSEDDVIVDVRWSGISTGTERLLYTGKMPSFPGMGYPLVPGYESVGQVRHAKKTSGLHEGDWVFVPGAQCFGGVRGLFGGTASRLVVPAARASKIDSRLGEEGVLLALAATAYHAVNVAGETEASRLIVGHGVLGRLLARVAMALDPAPPVVWETQTIRRDAATGYRVCDPNDDSDTRYESIIDASGDPDILDGLVSALSKGGTITLAGFYTARLSFAFPAAFMKEAQLAIAAEFTPEDVTAVLSLLDAGKLTLWGLISHREAAADAPEAYRKAFEDPRCVKMILDWSEAA